MMKRNRILGIIMTLGATVIWGSAFVAQRIGLDNVGPFAFSVARGTIAFAVTLLVWVIMNRGKLPEIGNRSLSVALKGGAVLGTVLFFAGNFQQFGLGYTSVAKAGFITTLYVAFVPFVGVLFHKRIRIMDILCAIVALTGLYFLSMNEQFSISKGDYLELGAAFFFSFHILFVDRFAPEADVVLMNAVQFFVFAALSVVPMLLTDPPSLANLRSAAVPILYAGILSGGAAYTLQILGQKHIEPSVSSLFMCFESVFAALSGWLILDQKLTPREFLGCSLVFCAALLSQLFAFFQDHRKRDPGQDPEEN